jgi:Sulfotransferase family
MRRPKELGVSVSLYGRSAVRVMRRARRLGSEERLVFVVGSPRSGTTFTGSALGSLPGFVDLDEVQPWKAAIPSLVDRDEDEAAARLRSILERVRLLGLARGLRGVEQTPETSFVLAAALRAYPEAVAIHVIRDGRDVVTSLLERGWLSAERTGADDARLPFGVHARFWVEPGREEEFARVSDATRAAWAWRRYVTAARAVPERTVEVRYEQLVADPAATAARVADRLGVAPGLVAEAFAAVHDRSAGRWRRNLTPEQLADVEREAGDTLVALGYELSATETRP